MRPVYVLPNLFTTASLFSALCAIVFISNGGYETACYLILLCAIFDALDGPVARWTRTTSSFGLQYDSLADLVAFGVAPAFLMYHKLEEIDAAAGTSVWAPRLAIGACALFAISGAIRLARFNIQVADEEKTKFTGMPIPAAAGTVVSTFLVVEQYLPQNQTAGLYRALLILMLLLAYLMVSTIPFPSLKGLKRRLKRSFNSLVTLVFLIFVIGMFVDYLPVIVLGMFYLYILLTVISVARQKRNLSRYSPGTAIHMEDTE